MAIEKGQTVGLIEVMKTFSPVRADASGVLVGWAKADGDGVIAGQSIGWVRPS